MKQKPDLKVVGGKKLIIDKEFIARVEKTTLSFIEELHGEIKKLKSDHFGEVATAFVNITSTIEAAKSASSLRRMGIQHGALFADPRITHEDDDHVINQVKQYDADDHVLFSQPTKNEGLNFSSIFKTMFESE